MSLCSYLHKHYKALSLFFNFALNNVSNQAPIFGCQLNTVSLRPVVRLELSLIDPIKKNNKIPFFSRSNPYFGFFASALQ